MVVGGNFVLREYKNKIVVCYVLLPLILFSVALPLLQPLYQTNSALQKHHRLPILGYAASVGLMSPDSKADVYYVHKGAKMAFDTYNNFYGDPSGPSHNWPIRINTAIGPSATVARLKTFLKSTDRVHIACHGRYLYDGKGPTITLADGSLTAKKINKWQKISGKCLVVFLSACYSLGRGKGDVDYQLAQAIKLRSNVRMVVGYSGEVDVLAATILAMSFWWAHIAGLRNTHYSTGTGWATGYGGYSGAASFSGARSVLQESIERNEALVEVTAIAIATAIGTAIGGPIGGASGFLVEVTTHVLGHYITKAILHEWLKASRDTLAAFIKIDNGEYVPSLTPVSGSGGGINKHYTTH